MKHSNLRNELESLYWPGTTEPVLTKTQLSHEPIKWLKYAILDAAALEPLSEISKQIRRFGIDSVPDAVAWCQQCFERHERAQEEAMVVVKVVPWNRGAQLKNFRMFGAGEVVGTLQRIAAEFRFTNHELWCCESSVAKVGFNVGGRLSFPAFDSGPEVLEIVWFGSPRLIESVRLPEFALPFARAVRHSREDPFEMAVTHVPSPYEFVTDCMREDVRWMTDQFQLRRRSIATLRAILRGMGAAEICLTFKVSDARLTIIDWDTQVESSQ